MSWMNRKSFINISQMVIDAICLIITYPIAIFTTGKIFRPLSFSDYLWVPVLFGMVYIFMMFTCEMYHRSTFTYQDRTLRYVLKSGLLAALFCLVMMPFASKDNVGIDFLIIFLLIGLIIMTFQYLTMQELRSNHNGRWNKRAVFVGCRENIQEYLYYIKKTSFQVNVAGYVMLDAHDRKKKNPDSMEELESVLKDNVVDEVIFAVPSGRLEEIKRHALLCRDRGLTVKLAMDFFESGESKTTVHNVGTIPVLTWQSAGLSDMQTAAKRVMDIAGSLIGLFFFVAASIVLIPLVKIFMGGSVFIHRTYLSLNGRPFTLSFFRTASNQSLENEKSVPTTLIGKLLRRTGIDHLPMFWNVLRGDMSLVGTLPVSAADLDGLTNKQFMNISIKPGLTGTWRFADMSAGRDESFIAELNRQYMNKWSLRRDIWLLMKTIVFILIKKSSICLLTRMEEIQAVK